MKISTFLKEGMRLWYMLPPVTLAKYARALFPLIPYRPAAGNIMATHNCNSRCLTCSMWNTKSSEELSTEEMCDVMDQLKEVGVRRIGFSGGEPTLRTDLPQLIRHAHDLRFKHILVCSNGLSWNRRKAQEYLDNGLNRVTISIDGIGEIHDKQRGIEGAYEKSIETVRMLVDLRKEKYHDLDIEVETTITQGNLTHFVEVVKLCRQLDVGWMLSMFETVSLQFNSIDSSELRISRQEDLEGAISQLHRMKKSYPLSPVISHVALERVKRYVKGETSFDRRSNIPCVAGFTAIYVDAHGKVYPGCWAQPPAGDLRQQRLQDIIRAPKFRGSLKSMFAKECPTCPNSIIWGAYYYIPALVEEAAYRLRFLRGGN